MSRFERLPPAYQLAPKIATSRFVFLVRIATVSPSLSLSPFHTHRHSLSFSLFFVEHDVHLPRIIFLERPCRGRLSQGEIKYTHFRSFLFYVGTTAHGRNQYRVDTRKFPGRDRKKKKNRTGREIIRKAGLEETEVNTNRNEKKYNNNNNINNNNNNYKDWGLWLRGLLEWIKSVSSESQEIDLSHYIVVTRLLYIYNNSVYL